MPDIWLFNTNVRCGGKGEEIVGYGMARPSENIQYDVSSLKEEEPDLTISISLTERERQILTLGVAGKLNKQIAAELQLAEPTVKLHGGHMMRKMKATSVANLVKIIGGLS